MPVVAIAVQLLVAGLSAAVLGWLLTARLPWKAALGYGGGLAFLVTAMLTLVLNFTDASHLVYEPKNLYFLPKYAAAYLPAWLAFALLALAACGIISIHRDTRSRWSRGRIIASILGVLLFTLAALLGFGSYWIHDYFGAIDIDEVMFTLATGRDHNTNDLTNQVVNYVVAPTIIAAGLAIVAACWNIRIDVLLPSRRVKQIGAHSARSRRTSWRMSASALHRVGMAVTLVAVVATGAWFTRVVPVGDLLFPPDSTKYIEENYVAPSAQNISFPSTKRNLVHIVMESMENTFYDKAEGGALEQNAMPDMAALSAEGISFSNTDQMGGFKQTTGATYTVGGVVDLMSGLPLKAPMLDTDVQSFVFPDFTMMGDLLKEQGYNNEIVMGANADFGSKRSLFTQHGDFKIFDHQYAVNNGYLPKDYSVWWGYEDAKLYGFAQQEVTALAAKDQPFYFVLETADTHFPGGYIDDTVTDRPFSEQYANVVYHSQQQAVEFVRWLQQQPFWENTTVLITGDHLSMEQDFFKQINLDPSYERTVLNIFLNATPGEFAEDRTKNRQFVTADIFPTTLAAIGATIDGDRLGLGTNLFSNSPTLVERDGYDAVETNMKAPSSFYDEHVGKNLN